MTLSISIRQIRCSHRLSVCEYLRYLQVSLFAESLNMSFFPAYHNSAELNLSQGKLMVEHGTKSLGVKQTLTCELNLTAKAVQRRTNEWCVLYMCPRELCFKIHTSFLV